MIKTIKKLFGVSLDFRVRLFNILAAAGTLISLVTGITGLFTDAGIVNVMLCMITMIVSVSLLWYSFISGKYQLCYTISIVIIFLVLFPALFFSAGGYFSGMPSFFIFAVLFTVFMLEGKKMIVITVFELAVYTSICLFAYYNKGMIKFYNTEADILIDIIISFIIVSAALGVTMALHLRSYNLRQKELEAARRQVEEYAKMKSELFAGMSHEMRTPLTVMSTYAQFAVEQIRETVANEQTLSDLATISDEAKRLAEMVDGTLKILMASSAACDTSVTRPGTAGDVFGGKKNSSVDMGVLSSRLVKLLEPVALRKGKKLSVIIDAGIPEISGDADALIQLVWNLLQNAITHSDGESITLNVETYTGDGGYAGNFAARSGVKVIICDNGSGIDPEILPYIFQRGFSGKKSGSGIGLSICRDIAKSHGGDISVKSVQGSGTCVTVFLASAPPPPERG